MRTHRISAKTPKNRKAECYECGGMFTPEKANVFCPGKPVAPAKKGRRV